MAKPAPAHLSPRSRTAAFVWLGGFALSSFSLANASTPGAQATTGGRIFEVGLIVVLVAITVWLQAQTTSRISLTTLWRAYGVAALLPAMLLIGVWQYQAALVLDIFMPGLAWRLWLMLYTLPHILVALRQPEPPIQ